MEVPTRHARRQGCGYADQCGSDVSVVL